MNNLKKYNIYDILYMDSDEDEDKPTYNTNPSKINTLDTYISECDNFTKIIFCDKPYYIKRRFCRKSYNNNNDNNENTTIKYLLSNYIKSLNKISK